jgi:DNA end-binding protein Ku
VAARLFFLATPIYVKPSHYVAVSISQPVRAAAERIMAASVWTGYLTFGLISMPVRLFSGARGTRVSFHMLHRDDNVRVKQQLYCPQDERVVERNEIVKGFEYRKGEYVVVEPDEIKKIEPKTAKSMEILEFVKAEEIDPIYFESSYYLTPEEPGKRPYALLVQALRETDYVAIAKLAMHNREYTVFLRPYDGGLMLHTMYYQDEIRRVEGFGTEDVKVKEAEVKIAHQLIKALEAKFDPSKYYDTFEENVKKLIKARLEGREVTPVEKPRKPAPVVDLMSALKQSLSQMEGKKKGPQRAAIAQGESEVHAVGKKQAAKSPRKKAA